MKVVVAGGGVAGLESVIALRDLAGGLVEITLVAPEEDFVFKPLSVGEPFALGEAQRLPLKRVARDFDLDLVSDGLAEVSADTRTVRLAGGNELRYDKLVIAVGAAREPPFEHGTVFRGQEDSETMHGLVQDLEGQYIRRAIFVVPTGVAWSLPLYELALMTARRAHEMSLENTEITIVTPEERPLAVFGPGPSEEVRELLDHAGIHTHLSAHAELLNKNVVRLHPGGDELTGDRIVTLPRLRGYAVPSLPHDESGFLPIDVHGRVTGAEDVYAAGDGTNFPIKQGGIACQQADAAAEAIAQEAGAPIAPEPFRPVLRGQLITGRDSHFMRTDLTRDSAENPQASPQTLWWPPSKIAGRYLAPYVHELDAADERERDRRESLMTREYDLRP